MTDPRQDSARAPARRRSLAARAALFTLTGSGAFLGVLVMLSTQLLDDARERLLEERSRLARTTARLLEARLHGDMSRIADAANLFVEPHEHSAWHMSHGVVLRHAVSHGAFREGAFVLDAEGTPLTSAPGPLEELDRVPGVAALIARARVKRTTVISKLTHIGKKPVLVAVSPAPHDGPVIRGFVVGLFQPAASDLLRELRDEASPGRAEITLTDEDGEIVGSTDRHRILSADSREEISCAITEGREIRGACEQCEGDDCEPAVMASAPLPNLGLGLSVVQARSVAFAPTRALQRQLWSLGGVTIVLFVLFNMLAVRSVVRPVTALTWAVRRSAEEHKPMPSHRFGADEVGELADALGQARAQALEALAKADAARATLEEERDAIRAHLDTLQGISAASTRADGLEDFVALALAGILDACEARGGVLGLHHQARTARAQVELTPEEADRATEALVAHADRTPPKDPEPCVPLGHIERPAGPFEIAGRMLRPSGDGPELSLVVAPNPDRPHPDALWIESLLQHTAVCAAHLLLREANRERQAQQARYLRRVMQAQEDERRRVARELHDTVAQDLAALRLAVERAANHTGDPGLSAELDELEHSATDMLVTVRRILLDLRLSVLDEMGFVPAVRWLLERTERERTFRTHLALDGEPRDLLYERAVTLFRILQEALLNVSQHAKAEHVYVTVRFAPSAIELIVEDDGRGFDRMNAPATAARPDGRGLGLLGMEERAGLLGGELEVTSAPGEGTCVRVRVPEAPVAAPAVRLEPTAAEVS